MKPVVPTTTPISRDTHQARFSSTASGWVKSTATSASLGRRAVVPGVEGGDELQVRRRLDGPAHLGPHPPAGAEHGDLDRHGSPGFGVVRTPNLAADGGPPTVRDARAGNLPRNR